MTISYREAAVALWGAAGEFAHDEYAHHRGAYFGDRLPEQLPIVIGITAYAHVMGLCQGHWDHGPRISIESRRFGQSLRWVSDIILHEMTHAAINVAGLDSKHKGEPWYAEVRRLAPLVLGASPSRTIKRGADHKSVRVPNPAYTGPGCGQPKTLVRKTAVEHDGFTHHDVASWPHSFRPRGYYTGDRTLYCPIY